MNDKEKEKYDPRKEYSYVPAFLVCFMATLKGIAFISPYYAGVFEGAEQVGLLLSITQDDSYNMLLSALIGYWIRGEAIKKAGQI